MTTARKKPKDPEDDSKKMCYGSEVVRLQNGS